MKFTFLKLVNLGKIRKLKWVQCDKSLRTIRTFHKIYMSFRILHFFFGIRVKSFTSASTKKILKKVQSKTYAIFR